MRTKQTNKKQKQMTVPTKNCPPIEQGGPGKGLSVLQRGQLPGAQGGNNTPTWKWYKFPIVYSDLHAQCRHIQAIVPVGGVHTWVFNVPQHVATCKKEGTLAFLLDLAQDTIWPWATPIWRQCHPSRPFQVCKLGGWG